ncbi:MAG: 50S ribosomal protein L24 [Armatimonadetes bacterium]|nr:50S ribosomal protein L24 [Armatimonadota bacterium]MBS1704057.1 50S ribosomal protein L24 [Armatimonadota bacterium]MBS1725599.1 50S ribosomal protein L24 [Armatimonadota bacterium]
MPTKAELKRLAKPIKLKIRRGDKVMIIAGKDKGEVGFVAAVSPKENKVIVLKENPENPEQPLPLNQVIKHRKARTQGERSARIALPAPIHISNVMVLDPKTGQPTRVGKKKEGDSLVRYAKKSGTVIKTDDTK